MPVKKIYTDEEARQRKNQRQREYAKRTGYASQNKYNKQNTKTINIRLGVNDIDILEHLDKKNNKAGYIKELIRKDIKKDKG